MKSLMLVFLVIGATLIFFGCSENNPSASELSQGDQVTNSLAKKPLTGHQITPFTLTPPTFWNGTVDFGEDGKYGLTFVSYEPPRAYSQASPFYEDFYIYEEGSDWTNPANVYLKGWNAGVVTYANNPPDPCKFLANGKVEEAYGPLEEWLGRNVHIRGTVYWKIDPVVGMIPEYAEATFRIN
ncbi:MAG: hypothetical protein KJN64_14760 [Ignavibacteria bacterium]|nr:hypothetical protein [Ignavibacteria bacterium]